jgi:hypothetical protein
MTRAALLAELEELERMVAGAMRLPAKAAVMGTRVAIRENMLIGVLCFVVRVCEWLYVLSQT